MALQKQGFNIPFGQGLDTKTDPKQVVAGKLLNLSNAVFNKGGELQKRNGYAPLATLPNAESTNLTTLNGNLIATGSTLSALSADTSQWLNKGTIQPVALSTLPAVRTSTSQTVVDSKVHPMGLACIAYTESTGSSYYTVIDSVTGQSIITITQLPATAALPRVFILGNNFVITYLVTVSASTHLDYIAIPANNQHAVSSPVTLSTQVKTIAGDYDGIVANSTLYLSYNASDLGGAVRTTLLTSTLIQGPTRVITSHSADLSSVTADTSGNTPVIWVSFWQSSNGNAYAAAYDAGLNVILATTQFLTSTVINKLTSIASGNTVTELYQVTHNYSYESVRSDFVSKNTVTQGGVVGSPSVLLRGVGLGTKPFEFNSVDYVTVSYGQAFQPTYFLCDLSGNIIMKLAYSNGIGYATSTVLPSISINNDNIQFCYLFKTLIQSVNKTQGVANVAGIYAQTGVNLASFEINNSTQFPSEIARTLHLTGGFLWEYDAIKPVEHSFHVWPEDVLVTTVTTGGNLKDQQYFYVATYEWTDGQGNLHRSAPSVPFSITTAGGNTSTNTINVPTLRLTYKTSANPVRIIVYRWSVAQQNYYQITSISSPVINNPAVDSVAITDTLADASILGNTLLYTTGGVLENIAAPACSASTLFKSRLFLVDAEDRNLLWFSKQVIEATPVEFSDLLTLFVAPTSGAQGSTGPITALSAMDDKLIIFKENAIYYMVGDGPDNTGANNNFSEPTFITATVGCTDPDSIVFQPQGLMFQSDKGIWLLGRDLSTQYVGAEVEQYNTSIVNSSVNIPAQNQVRFTLNSGIVLMYDYYYGQWGTFTNIPATSSTLYQGFHTYVNSLGQVLQETPGAYLDNSNPVLMSFTTAWLKLTQLQGFQRAYFMYLLSNYLTPHKLNIQISYDYGTGTSQTVLITPDNFNPPYGSDPLYGNGSPYGYPDNVEQWRIFFNKQKCQSIQIAVTEVFDASFGVASGAGLTFSGINMVVAGKATYPKLPSARSAG